MGRTRISTTVDERRLSEVRRLLNEPDSRLIDRALLALTHQIRAERENAALDAHPYEGDPELSWEVPLGPALDYDGEVPPDVVALAASRRAR